MRGLIIADEPFVHGVVQIRRPGLCGNDAKSCILQSRERHAIDREDRVELADRIHASLLPLLDKIDTHTAGLEDKSRWRLRRSQRRKFSLKICLAKFGVNFGSDFSLEVTLEARKHVFSSLIIRRHYIDRLNTLAL